TAMRRLREHGAEAGNLDFPFVEARSERVHFRARQDLAAIDQREPLQMASSPGSCKLRVPVALVRRGGEALVPNRKGRLQDLVENPACRRGKSRRGKICHGGGRLYGSFLNVGQ